MATRLVLLFALAVSSSCSAAFWTGFAEGLSAGLAPPASAVGQSADASAQERLCVKYRTASGWSKGYLVTADVLKGSELNRRTRTYSYSSFSTYVVIFWAEGQASVLQLNYYFGSISAIGIDAVDQRKLKWNVAKTSICY